MRFGLDIPTTGDYADPRILADLAADAEDAGWDGFFVWDIIFAEGDPRVPVADPWLALTAVALRTRRIRLGAMLTPLPRRLPWEVARQTATLDRLSDGRLVFGAGLGYQALDFTPFGQSFDPKTRAAQLDEGLAILQGLWTGAPFTFHGAHYTLDDVTMRPTPAQSPRIPIWTAAGWPVRKPLRRAARWDGVYLMTVNQTTGQLLTPDEIREIAAFVRANRDDPAAPFDITVNGETVGDTPTDRDHVRPYADAGATWWIEYEASRPDLAAYRERIRRGPPHL
jgi:alkanesulfonate monooxygenase SsuD/methylene tetrahydromethanopterin reductase-like flavin-dependent oxidoreductase (luciferase family)